MRAIGKISIVRSAIGIAEMGHGIYCAHSPQLRDRRAFRDELKATVPIRPVPETAEIAARVGAEQAGKGINLPLSGLPIRACALELGSAVVTGNLRDFGRVPGLTVKLHGRSCFTLSLTLLNYLGTRRPALAVLPDGPVIHAERYLGRKVPLRGRSRRRHRATPRRERSRESQKPVTAIPFPPNIPPQDPPRPRRARAINGPKEQPDAPHRSYKKTCRTNPTPARNSHKINLPSHRPANEPKTNPTARKTPAACATMKIHAPDLLPGRLFRN